MIYRTRLTLYGRSDCEDTERVRSYLRSQGDNFTLELFEVNIDEDPLANQFVLFVNNGYRVTPTLVLDFPKRTLVYKKPSDADLEELVQNFSVKY